MRNSVSYAVLIQLVSIYQSKNTVFIAKNTLFIIKNRRENRYGPYGLWFVLFIRGEGV